ncbi:hypothetical protein GCM10025787_16170 [Saccharopolyspora rosea]
MRALAGDSTITKRRPPGPAPLRDAEARPVPPFFFVRVDPATLTCSLLAVANLSGAAKFLSVPPAGAVVPRWKGTGLHITRRCSHLSSCTNVSGYRRVPLRDLA